MVKFFKKTIAILFIIFFVLLMLLNVYVGIVMFHNFALINDNDTTKAKSKEFLSSVGFDKDTAFADYSSNWEVVEISSTRHKHVIPADYITADGNKDNNTVILVHGISGDRTTVYPMCEFFLNEGYNVLCYDQRNCGDNKAKYTSFGYLESNDLSDCIKYVEGNISEDKSITLFGQSSGATTISLYARQSHAKQHIDFIIFDSPLVNFEDMARDSLENIELKLPKNYMLLCGTWANKIKLGFFYGDIDMKNKMYDCMIPTLIIQSQKDTVSSYEAAEAIYDMIPHNSKRMCTLLSSLHMMGFYDYPDEYKSTVKSMMATYADGSTGEAVVEPLPEEDEKSK